MVLGKYSKEVDPLLSACVIYQHVLREKQKLEEQRQIT